MYLTYLKHYTYVLDKPLTFPYTIHLHHPRSLHSNQHKVLEENIVNDFDKLKEYESNTDTLYVFAENETKGQVPDAKGSDAAKVRYKKDGELVQIPNSIGITVSSSAFGNSPITSTRLTVESSPYCLIIL